MSKRNTYTPPEAELILLEPSEKLATLEWSFEKLWKNSGYHEPANGQASAFVFQTAVGASSDAWDDVPGFTIKQ